MIESLIVGVVCLVAGGIGSKATRWVDQRGSEDETAKLSIVKLTSGVEQRVARLEATAEARHDP